MSPKILLVLHDDSLSGAPVAALNFARLLKTRLDIDLSVVVVNYNNVLTEQFRGLGISVLTNSDLKVAYPRYQRLRTIRKYISDLRKNNFRNAIRRINDDYDIILFNSVVSLDYCRELIPNLTIRKFVFVHELQNAIDLFLQGDYEIINQMDGVFVPSEAARNNLVHHGIKSEKLFKIPLIIEAVENPKKVHTSEFVVGNLANPGWPKGFDYFLAIAKYYCEQYPSDSIRFVWKGFRRDTFEYKLSAYEIDNAGLTDVVSLEMKEEPNDVFFQNLDVLIMPSKEDTFGIVMLEAAQWQVPSIGFSNTGGIQEFIESYGGLTVPYLSIKQFVQHIKYYYEHRAVLQLHGEAAQKQYLSNHTINEEVVLQVKTSLTTAGWISEEVQNTSKLN
jgi:glycosyltransferase involved in cell wall biosynthesis